MFDRVLNTPLYISEAVTGAVFCKKMFLKILQISQESTCVGVSF